MLLMMQIVMFFDYLLVQLLRREGRDLEIGYISFYFIKYDLVVEQKDVFCLFGCFLEEGFFEVDLGCFVGEGVLGGGGGGGVGGLLVGGLVGRVVLFGEDVGVVFVGEDYYCWGYGKLVLGVGVLEFWESFMDSVDVVQ